MESDRALIAMLALVLLIVISNLVVFAVARGMTRGGGSNWMSAMKDSFSKPGNNPANKSMDELRTRVDELEARKKKDDADG
jgi:hypothetical protein